MDHFFVDILNSNFAIFKHFGYIIVFLVALFESVPLLGMLIPGQTVVILSGFLVKVHVFGFWATILVATLGAVLGDTIGYFLGKKYGSHFSITEKKFFIKREQFLKAKIIIEKNPFKSIFFGRLHSLTRTITPFASGASNVGIKKFVSIELISALVWAFVSVSIGYIFGKSFEKAASFIGEFVLVGTLIAICILILVNLAKKKNIEFGKVYIYSFIASSISLYLFALIVQNIDKGSFFYILDHRIYLLKDVFRTVFFDNLFIILTILTNTYFQILYFVLFCIYLTRKNMYRDLLLTIVSLSSGIIVLRLIKDYFGRMRPVGFIHEYGNSFPSGHSMIAMMCGIIIIYIFTTKIRVRNKTLFQLLIYGMVFIIGISRIYLGVHWVSDVFAGFLLGIFWSTLIILLFKTEKFFVRVAKSKHEIPLP